MNTLYIHEGCIDFIGFDELNDKAYISFRHGGVAISGNRLDIKSPQKEFLLNTKQVTDDKLSSLLILFGFSNIHSFIQDTDGVYFCEYPDVPSKSHEELLLKYGMNQLLNDLHNK